MINFGKEPLTPQEEIELRAAVADWLTRNEERMMEWVNFYTQKEIK